MLPTNARPLFTKDDSKRDISFDFLFCGLSWAAYLIEIFDIGTAHIRVLHLHMDFDVFVTFEKFVF